jgi:hypothetical protein
MTDLSKTGDREQSGDCRDDSAPSTSSEVLDPNDSNLLRDKIKGQTKEHAKPPRLEDEGQSGG